MVAGVTVALGGCAIFGVQSSASCIGPTFEVAPDAVTVGDAVEVTLSDAISECNDTGGGSVGWAEGQLGVTVTASGAGTPALTVPMTVEHGAGSVAVDTAALEPGTYTVGVDGWLDVAVTPVTVTVAAG